MSHTDHIRISKHALDFRWAMLRAIREWFWQQSFLEVETPAILRLAGQEPYLSPMEVTVHNEKGEAFPSYLHTSPEYAMKKMLAAGYDKIFFMGKCFRDYEFFGGLHNPEFTMLEFYETHGDIGTLMDRVEELCGVLTRMSPPDQKKDRPFRRIHMRALWQETIGVDLNDYLDRDALFSLCVTKEYNPKNDEPYEDLFFRIFLNEIEPKLAHMGIVCVHHYPLPLAALSKASETDTGYAERVEVYIDGIEVGNGFSELTDAHEQKNRLMAEQVRRKELGKPVYDIDEEFITAVGELPPCAGIAIGVDRLVQIFTGCKNINSVLVLPMKNM
ncbi:MAG: EF-P lysine aminoacylase GenX [Candidatus Magasanikbacteria bacterium]|nr:EF-P lysine aminoacylase GenX [Candidatus Magasanikbacteria bacterium]